MALRVRTRWHDKGRARSPGERAGVVASLVWRSALATIKHMREAQFDIDIGRPYFDVAVELMAFQVHVADRIAYAGLSPEEREAFMTGLVLRLADIVEDNGETLVGAAAPGECRRHFIDRVNERGGEYATFDCGADGPDFGFRRYLGNRVLELMPRKDRSWVVDQIMDIEAPEMVTTLRRAMAGMLAAA
jgi:hypothetical protein